MNLDDPISEIERERLEYERLPKAERRRMALNNDMHRPGSPESEEEGKGFSLREFFVDMGLIEFYYRVLRDLSKII